MMELQNKSEESLTCFLMRNKLRLFAKMFLCGMDDINFDRLGISAQIDKKISTFTELNELAKAASDVKYAVIKGRSFEQCIYGNEWLRDSGDVDILVAMEDAKALHDNLIQLGYLQRTGPTSVHGHNGRILAAVASSRNHITLIKENKPVRRHKNDTQFMPYIKKGMPAVEVHDSIRGLSAPFLENLLSDSQSDSLRLITNPLLNFILLIANTYENSESFYSNSFDYGIVLRDYVDLAFFFKRYMQSIDWNEISNLIEKYHLERKVSIVLSNMKELFCYCNIPQCLPIIPGETANWNTSISQRITNKKISEQSAIICLKKSLIEKTNDKLFITPTETFIRTQNVTDCGFKIETHLENLYAKWIIPTNMLSDNLLLQTSFFSLNDNIDDSFLSYKLSVIISDDEYHAYWRKSSRLFQAGAIKKETGISLPVTVEKQHSISVVTILLGCDISSLIEYIIDEGEMVVVPDVYQHKYADVFWSITKNHTEIIEGVFFSRAAMLLKNGMTLYISTGNTTVRVEFDDYELAEQLIGAFPYASTYWCLFKQASISLKVTNYSNHTYVVSKNGIVISREVDAKNALRIVVQAISDNVISLAKNNIIAAHAGAITFNGGLVLLMGSSGSGKSSLAIAASNNYPLLNDECILIDSSTGYAWSEDIPFLIKENNRDLLSKLENNHFVQVNGGVHGAGRYYARSCVNYVQNPTIKQKIRAIVFPEYLNGENTMLEKQSLSTLVERIMCSIIGEHTPSLLFRMVTKMISSNGIKLIKLKYGNVDEASLLLSQFLDDEYEIYT